MVDIKKRKTLKVITGSAVIAVASPVVSAACIHGSEHSVTQTDPEDIIVPVTSSGTELSVSLSVEPEPIVRLTNNSDRLIIVRHVYPGIVHAGDKAFNINSIFERCAYAISPGTSREAAISPTVHTAEETTFPRHLYRKQPQRVAAVTGHDNNGMIVNSSRSFYS